MWIPLISLLWLSAQPPVETSFGDTLVVTAAREEERLEDAVAPVTVLSRDELLTSPSRTLDAQLRARLPGFSLFRRSSSLDAHPTTQGVSLRGLGPSGTSRGLVLFDGMPLNDPFGGWVTWNRLPGSALAAVEVVPGAASQLYGSSALGGTIQLLPRSATGGTLELSTQAGGRGLRDAELFASGTPGAWGLTAAVRSFDTDGFFLLAEEDLGAVDRPARVDFDTVYGRATRGGFHASAQLYREDRGNGTALQGNATRIGSLEGGFGGERWSWSLYGQRQRFESTFSRVSLDRGEEVLTEIQDVRSSAAGGSLTFRLEPGLLLGIDGRRVAWQDDPQGRSQLLAGVFAQKRFNPRPRLGVLLGARLDLWQNRATRTRASPRAGAVYRASTAWTLRGSVTRGFRAPTLNELYRPFRVGNIVTAANPDLDAEQVTGVEIGGDLQPPRRRGDPRLRLHGFWNVLDAAVGNVTVEVSPSEIRRRRENLGRVEVSGAELEAGAAVTRRWRLVGAYLLSHTEVAATGRRLPQVPRHQASLRLDGGVGAIDLTLEGRWVGEQFEDDLGELALDGFFTADVAVRGAVNRRLELSAAVENLFDQEITVGRLPLPRRGAPRQLRLGVRFQR